MLPKFEESGKIIFPCGNFAAHKKALLVNNVIPIQY